MRFSPGQHVLPHELVRQHQRTRIILAFAEETAEKGYDAVTVSDIVRRARVARNTFYEIFSSKEDCVPATSEHAVKEALRRVLDAAGKVDSWPARVRAGLDAFLRYVAAEPALARTCIVEALSAGPASSEHYEHSIQAFVPLFRMGRKISPKGDELPDTLEETIVGGIFWILYQRVVMGQVGEIEALLPELVEFSLTPYVGPEAARRAAAAG
ncbi:MAG: TetR/AcrR family transcriptional regulator [Solirubrobacterales bacterium]